MESFAGKLAVVTGGGSGMGRELVRQLSAAGCSVATCDINSQSMAEAWKDAPRVTTHLCDVSDPVQVLTFRDEVMEQHQSDHINLLFNNAGVGFGGGSFITGNRQEWERTFSICWGGVYNCCRAFVPLLVASDEGYLVNTSSVNGLWASMGPGHPHSAYSTAKFAVKGFTESLIDDFRANAPHVQVAVVMPGHVGTDIVANARVIHHQSDPTAMTEAELDDIRADLTFWGVPAEKAPAEQLPELMKTVADGFRDQAPLSAAEAATIILDGVRTGRWRILVGKDARALDQELRANPELAYDGRIGDRIKAATTAVRAGRAVSPPR
jgi:NAD(P)-dependent dehydrogenase (short-subunit alcohol dehydrogenase family)